MVITSARITAGPRNLMDFNLPKVYVTTEDGQETFLFDYYPDEISFQPAEFIGLTIEQARYLKFEKDKAYLQS